MPLGPESADPRAGSADDGLHPRRQDHGVPLRAPQEVSQGDIFKSAALKKINIIWTGPNRYPE
jgi:hypothetical protein